MCASIVQRAGGFISVDTAPGEGASFQIHLPVAAQGPATHPRTAPESVPGCAPPAPVPSPSCGWCVLLIEDLEPIRNLVARMLSARGVRVLEAPDLATARLFLAQPGIDLVLTDGRLPDGESLTLINEIRERHQARHVVVMSGAAPGSPGPAVDAVVPKPFRPDVLVETVLGLLAKTGIRRMPGPFGGLARVTRVRPCQPWLRAPRRLCMTSSWWGRGRPGAWRPTCWPRRG